MSFGSTPTVKVVSPEAPGGYVVINESDLTSDHALWSEEQAGADDESGEPAKPRKRAKA